MDAETVESETAHEPADVVIGGDEVTTYRTISAVAIIGLLLGIAAPLCLAAPLLLAIPLFGIAVTLLAVARVAASEGTMIGRRAALIGLGLCVGSLFMYGSRELVARQMISRQAREVALEWIKQLQAGNVAEAFGLSSASTSQPEPPPPRNFPGADETPPDPATVFRNNPVVRFLTSVGTAAKVHYVRDIKLQRLTRGQAYIQQQYDVSQPNSDREVSLKIMLERLSSGRQTPAAWTVGDFQSDDLPAPTSAE
jgi:hypothetical protein